jgi:hypothetical protein
MEGVVSAVGSFVLLFDASNGLLVLAWLRSHCGVPLVSNSSRERKQCAWSDTDRGEPCITSCWLLNVRLCLRSGAFDAGTGAVTRGLAALPWWRLTSDSSGECVQCAWGDTA